MTIRLHRNTLKQRPLFEDPINGSNTPQRSVQRGARGVQAYEGGMKAVAATIIATTSQKDLAIRAKGMLNGRFAVWCYWDSDQATVAEGG